MKLVIRKSECIKVDNGRLIKSPKEAIRKTLSNYLIKDGFIVNAYMPSFISNEEAVLRDDSYYSNITIKLQNNNSFTTIAN